MSKIGLTEGFTLIPEGTHIFKILSVDYKEEFGKLEIKMVTQGGLKHTERFGLLKNDGSPNEGAYNAFSYFAKTALQDFSLQEIDDSDLIGCFIECDVEHDTQPNQKKPGQTITFVRLADKRPSEGFSEQVSSNPTPAPKAAPAPAPAAVTKSASGKPQIDLKALLG